MKEGSQQYSVSTCALLKAGLVVGIFTLGYLTAKLVQLKTETK